MPWLLGLWTMLVVLNYAAAPEHHLAFEDLTGFLLPRHGAFAAVTLLDSWVSRGRAIAVWGVINAGVGGAGLVAARLLGVRPGLVRTWLMGLAPASLLLLGLGLTGLLHPAVPAAALIGCAVPLATAGGGRVRWCRERWLAAAPCLLALPAALAPEIVFDALRYHLALPAAYLQIHKMVRLDRFLFGSYPQAMEMLYLPALALGTTVSAKLLSWQTFAGSAVLLHGFLASRLPRTHAHLLCLGFTAMPFLSVHAATAGVDHPLIGLTLAAVLLLTECTDGRPVPRRAAVAGWLLGTAFGVKYLAAFAAGGAALALALAAPALLGPVARGALPWLVAVPAAWGIRNWLDTDNPVYPYALGHWALEPETFRLHLQWARDWQAIHPWWTAWATLIPVSLTRGLYDAWGEALAPALFLLVGLGAAAARPLDRTHRFLLALSATLWLVWVRSAGGIYRYLAPLYPVAWLALGALLPRLRGVSARAVTAGLALGAAVQVPLLLAAHARGAAAASVLLGWESERAYLHRIIPPGRRYLPAMGRARDTAGAGRILMLGDPKTFYAPGRWVTEFEFAPTLLLRLAADSRDADRLRIGLRQRGITTLLYRVEGMISVGRMSGALVGGDALARYQEFWRRWIEPAWVDEHPAENVFYQCSTVRRVPAGFIAPASALRFALPGMEALTADVDRALEQADPREALRLAQELTRAEPAYAAGWARLAAAARRAGDRGRAERSAAIVRQYGFERLLSTVR